MKRKQLWKVSLIVLLLAMFAGGIYITQVVAFLYYYYGYVYDHDTHYPLSDVRVDCWVKKDDEDWIIKATDWTDDSGYYYVGWNPWGSPPQQGYQVKLHYTLTGYVPRWYIVQDITQHPIPDIYMRKIV